MLFAPLEGWRRVEVTERRTRTGWAEVVRKLVDEDYPGKERIVLVMDNPVSWYGAGFEHASPGGVPVRGLRACGGDAHRPTAAIQVDWRFTTEDARFKLKPLYQSIQQ